MGEKLVVGPFPHGQKDFYTPFNIDNDAFPVLQNAYQFRGRVKRKRGTALLNRLKRYFISTSTSFNSGSTTITLNGSGQGNLITGFSLQATGSIIPGTVTITIGANVYTDPAMDGTLSGPHPGTINYANGLITIAAEAGNAASATFTYYPGLPVMGLEDFDLTTQAFPGTIGFDTTYAYNILNTVNTSTGLYENYSVSFYKNVASLTYPGYTQKTNWTPVTWNGQDYQQFWTINYQGALWATNGINVPFSPTNVGMPFISISGIAIVAAGPPAIITITTIGNHGLVIGDFVYLNEIAGMTGINFQTGYVTAVPAANQITVKLPNATIGGAYVSGGIVQYLTNRLDPTKDCIRWYDGDPTNGNVVTPIPASTKGWVNFCPPLSESNFSIGGLPAAQYYLAGARLIMNFKDRLLFLGPVVQTSATGSQRYLPDTVIYSQNGTPYYTTSFSSPTINYPLNPTTPPGYVSILVPDNQTATPTAWFEDTTGFGGNITAGTAQEIRTVSQNEDVLIVGFQRSQTKLIYSGNDIVPFNFFLINSEYGSTSTFSAVNFDKGVISRGSRGFVTTNQSNCDRIDLDIPDASFGLISNLENGTERVCAQRDFINEWIYFTYLSSQDIQTKFPNQTLHYNYREQTWAFNFESYTHYGLFRSQTGFTWQTVGGQFPTWEDWTQPWNSGTSDLLEPDVIAGNQQGFVMFRDRGTGEGKSLYIQSFSGNTITSPFHGLNEDDFIIISDCLGTVGSSVNGKIFQIEQVTANTFVLDPPVASGTYLGSGLITRLYQPFIQTKQFPSAWQMGRKTRIGVQQYLLTFTQKSQISLLIFLSQNSASDYNSGNIVPVPNSVNDSLIYSTVLFTCPESTNLGLTPSNINLQMLTAVQQSQIWHRINTSLIGDTVQLGFTISEAQMRDYQKVSDPFIITGATQANPCVLTADNSLQDGQLIIIEDVDGMTQLNFDPLRYNYYLVIDATPTTITIEVDSIGFDAYTSGGQATAVDLPNPTAEVELHGFILDLTPSQLLA